MSNTNGAQKTVWRLTVADVAAIVGDETAASLSEHELTKLADAFSEGSAYTEIVQTAVENIVAERE